MKKKLLLCILIFNCIFFSCQEKTTITEENQPTPQEGTTTPTKIIPACISNLITRLFINTKSFNLPVIKINIPDETEITTKTWLKDQGIDFAKMTIEDNSNNSNNLSEVFIDIKGRGNTSWDMPKKCYSIKLNKKYNLFGIANGKHKNWALIANYFDKSLIHNQLAYYLGTDIFTNMDWNPHTKQVNLFINGTYRGIYLLCERIKIDENEINIQDIKSDSTDVESDFTKGGWIVEVDAHLDETYTWRTNHKIPISLKEPDNYANWWKIKNKINDVEAVLYNDELWTKPEVEGGWRKYLDEDSFIDWYIVNEIAKNNDACWFLSVYMYYDNNDAKIHMGPLWDFDIGFGNINFNGCDNHEGFWIKNSGWHARLFQDSNFVARVKNRWNEKYADIQNLVAPNGIIDQFYNDISKDADYNFAFWPILGTYVCSNPTGYETRTTYKSEVDYTKDWLFKRINWLNIEINKF